MNQQKIDYNQLNTGFEFPSITFPMNQMMVDEYNSVIGDTNTLYKDESLVPPMAIMAFSMAALMKNITFPMGAIHLSQDIELFNIANPGCSITCHARVSRKQKMGESHLITIELNAVDQDTKPIMKGKTMFMLSEGLATGNGK